MGIQPDTGAGPMLENIYRTLPNFRGKRRIARHLFEKRLKQTRDLVVKGKYGTSYKLPNLSEIIAFDIFVNGIYEEDTHRFLMNHVPKNGCLLDLGANIGAISIPLCKRRSDIKVLCVEAAPWIFEYLKYNVEKNQLGNQIKILNKAVSNVEGTALPFYSPREEFGKGSLAPVFTQEAVMVECATIDGLRKTFDLPSISLIKIDIEGFEYFAFQGGRQLLTSGAAPDIIFEFVSWAEEQTNMAKGSAQKLLMEFGYTLYHLEDEKLIPISNIILDGGASIFATKRKLTRE